MVKLAEQRITENVMRLFMYELGKLGYSHSDIGGIIDVSPRTVDKYPSGEVTPKLESFLKLIKEVQPYETLQKICALPLPETTGEAHEVLKHMGDVAKEFSEVVNRVSAAVSPKSDGGASVTRREAKTVLSEINELLEQVLIMKRVIEEVAK
jgi:predicted transcriptional regulator